MLPFAKSRRHEVDYNLVQDGEESARAVKKARETKGSIWTTTALPWTAAVLFALLSGWLLVCSYSQDSLESFERGWKTDFSRFLSASIMEQNILNGGPM